MEGMAYSLSITKNKELENLLDYWIYLIARSQQPDGYLNTYYTLNHPDKRWTDIGMHEMYCGGHMIEAAVAHYKSTGKTTFLDVATKFADYLDSTFGPGKKHWVPGHEEIELALVKLYHVTGKEKYLNLAYWLLEERGREFTGLKYNVNIQNDVPVSQITDIKGHAVRAMYLFSGMADVFRAKQIPEYEGVLNRVWDDVVQRNMYITGGIGSSKSNEGFTEDYDLPNKTAYCETCASIGMVFWNNRMNLLSGDAKYADVMERSLYNGVLSGVSLAGDFFFYVNPLESDGDHHRQRWFGCACCPSNIARFIPSVGDYIYAKSSNGLWINLFIGSSGTFTLKNRNVTVKQTTEYPWNGRVQIAIHPDRQTEFDIHIRIPGWANNQPVPGNTYLYADKSDAKFSLSLNGSPAEYKMDKGYAVISKKWKKGDIIVLDLPMPVRRIIAIEEVKEDRNRVALQRGPLVYCFEHPDNNGQAMNIIVPDNITFTNEFKPDLLNGVVILKAQAPVATVSSDGLKVNTELRQITAIPYYSWANRGKGEMQVWVPRKAARVRLLTD